jgi:hypothetical protein
MNPFRTSVLVSLFNFEIKLYYLEKRLKHKFCFCAGNLKHININPFPVASYKEIKFT